MVSFNIPIASLNASQVGFAPDTQGVTGINAFSAAQKSQVAQKAQSINLIKQFLQLLKQLPQNDRNTIAQVVRHGVPAMGGGLAGFLAWLCSACPLGISTSAMAAYQWTAPKAGQVANDIQAGGNN